MRLTQGTRLLAVALAATMLTAAAQAEDVYGLSKGKVELQSVGPLAFGPDGIVFVGDSKAAALYAIQTGDKSGGETAPPNISGLNVKLAEVLKSNSQNVEIADLAVNPQTGNVVIAVGGSRPALVLVRGGSELQPIDLSNVSFAKTDLRDAPRDGVVGEGRRARNPRNEAITDLAWVDGHVLVSGLSTAEAPSSIRTIAFPFSDKAYSSSLEIFHAAHGRVEDNAPVRTFIPFTIDGEPNVLAGFTCTPLVRFPLKDLRAGEKIRGTTVAELGNRNRPLDMIHYNKDGRDYLLMANSARGVMKINTDKIEQVSVDEPVRGGGTAGTGYETVEGWDNVVQLDKLGDHHAVVLIQTETGAVDLKTKELP